MIKIDYKEQENINSWNDGNYLNATFCVTEDCNLRCTYCYMVGKNNINKMSFETAKDIVDFLLADKYTTELSDSIMLDFIGGEPLLEMELIDKICDYFILKMYTEKHKWFPNYMFTFSTNGTLYGQPLVRKYIEKHNEHCSFSISIDGTKEKHNMARKKIDGSGSYDDVIKNLPLYLSESFNPSTKSTFSSDDLHLLKDSIIHLWDLGFKNVESNLVYENVWKPGDDEIFENQLKGLADYMFETGRYKTHSVAYFNSNRGLPVGKSDLRSNRCGAGYKSLAFDYKGDIYPCIRFLEMCAQNKVKKVIGNIETGVDYSLLRPLAAATWYAVSPEKCNTCDCGTDCGWCLAQNLAESDNLSIMDRGTHICNIHKANSRANKYYWKKYEEVTGYTSKRTLEKVKKTDADMLRYLYIITADSEPSFCNYSINIKNQLKMSEKVLKKGLEYCIDNEIIPIFIGKCPIYIDPRKKLFFEISKGNLFTNPATGVSIIDCEDIKNNNLDIITSVVTIKLVRQLIKELPTILRHISANAKRINLFIEDMQFWNEDDIENYEFVLEKLAQFVVEKYTNKEYNYQINVLTDRLYTSGSEQKDCGVGISSVTLAPNGKFYICPAFYYNNIDDNIGDIDKGINSSNTNHYHREKSSTCSTCKSNVCNRCLYLNKHLCGEINTPSEIQCRLNYIEANISKKLSDTLSTIVPPSYYMNRFLPKLDYINFVAAEIYKDERAEASRWMY